MPEVKKLLGNKIQYATSPLNCIRDADCCIIITEWNEFKKIKPAQFKSEMRNPIIIDGRKIYNPQEFTKQLTYRAIGLGPMEENK
jgi:UDPglucose 6-dehydrogenase